VAIGDQRKELEDFKCSKGNQVRGASHVKFVVWYELYENHM